MASLDDGTTGNRIQLYRANNNGVPYAGFVAVTSGSLQVNINGGLSGSTRYTLAGGYLLNSFAASLNGSSSIEDSSATVATTNRLTIGSGPALGAINGHICRLTYFPQRLGNEVLQKLTV